MGQLKRFLEAGGELPTAKGADTAGFVKRAADKAARIVRENPNMGYPLAAKQAASPLAPASAILSELGRRGGEKRANL